MADPRYEAPNGTRCDVRFDHWLPNLINRNGATTMGRTVLFGRDAPLTADLVAHEVHHVPQWCWLGTTSPWRFLWYPVFFVLYWLLWLPGLLIGIFTDAPGNPLEWGPWKVGYTLEVTRAYRDAKYDVPADRLADLAAWERFAVQLSHARAKARLQGGAA